MRLTPEQQRRIEENRKRALARRAERQTQITDPGPAQNKHTQSGTTGGTAKNNQLFASDRAQPGAPTRQVGIRNVIYLVMLCNKVVLINFS